MADEATQAAGGTQAAEGGTPDFDGWLAGQDETVRGLIDTHTSGLRSALQQERATAKAMAKQLKELSSKAEAGSELAKQLAEMQGRVETEQRRADFYEAATAAGCRNVKLAWLAANGDKLTVEQVKAQYPDLFAAARPPATNAGSGAAAAAGGAGKSMDAFIRRAAGRG